MNAFFCDLDNTLIYSHRREIGDSKILVECLNGKEQSYMTERAFSFFRDLDWLSLIPVTTRSEAQYRRLLFPETFHIQYALICNGGKLLVQDEEDMEWTKETLEMVREDLPNLEKMGERLHELCGHDIYTPECYYYYTKVEDPEKICEDLNRLNLNGNIWIGHDHHKVYLYPQCVNKGTAIRRFTERYQIKLSVGAGDSIIDIPMLNEVDYPLAAAALCESINRPMFRKLTGEAISDQICDELEDLHSNSVIYGEDQI